MVTKTKDSLPAALADKVPASVEKVAAKALQIGYGMTFGALYGLLREKPRNLATEGIALGLATWAIGYLGWLPATDLMPNVLDQKPRQVAEPIVEHIVFGIVAVAALRGMAALRQR